MKAPFVRHPYNYDMDKVSRETAYVDESGEVLVQQSAAEDCDINVIVRRFGLTGQLPQGARVPTYGDFDHVSDFHEAADLIRAASESFMELPGEVRARFENDPGQLVDFVSDRANLEEARKLGLVPGLVEPSVAVKAGAGAPGAAPSSSLPVAAAAASGGGS